MNGYNCQIRYNYAIKNVQASEDLDYQGLHFSLSPPLPEKEFVDSIAKQFAVHGKTCSAEIALQLVSAEDCFPYYAQKLAYFVFENVFSHVSQADLDKGIRLLLRNETSGFEGLAPGADRSQHPAPQPINKWYLPGFSLL